MSAKIFAFIFARGGSKGLPGKNVRPLGGIPLIGHSIRTARACSGVQRIIVSTDDNEIARVAREQGAEVPFMRPAELASDTAPEWLAWRHAIESVGGVDAFDIFLSLPATSPLRSTEDVEKCIDLLEHSDADVVVSMRDAERNPYFNMVKAAPDGKLQLFATPPPGVHRRQDAPPVFDLTTVAYVTRPEFVLKANRIFDGTVRGVVVPWERAVDIDTENDFAIAELLWHKLYGKPTAS
ncbi:MAG: acylneuraminate cytidylyltransferase [Verrucomicrobia bacterium Tous-C9LFEB]|nr:MAG: acylneuraminate cytidylyltransferase [Verrucomicrobia bacterium Tous-C9LFEB]